MIYTEEEVERAARIAARKTAEHGLAFTHAFSVRMVKRHLACPAWYQSDIESDIESALKQAKASK